MKHFTQFFLAVLVALVSTNSASAITFTVNDINYETFEKDGITVASVSKGSYIVNGILKQGYRGNIVIPSTVTYRNNTYPVVSICEDAFQYSPDLISVSIPVSIPHIPDAAFYQCTSLETVNLTDGVTSIGASAFGECSNLKSIEIPYGVTEIKAGTFSGCKKLEAVSIPQSVSSIGKNAFHSCSSLVSLILPESIIRIESGAFYECVKLIEINIPTAVGALEENTFTGCSSLLSITIPEGVKSIQGFSRCYKLQSVNIPESTTLIGKYAFMECNDLASINIPGGVTEIGDYAFLNSGLTSVTINCSNPSEIILGKSVFNGKYVPCSLYVPAGSKQKFETADQWKDFTSIEEYISHNLIDGKTYSLDEDRANFDLTYTRTFNSTNWQPLYIPFNMSYDEWSEYADVAEIRGIYSYDDSEGAEHTVLAFHRLTSGELKPNTPYVIKPKEIGEVTFACTNKTLKAAENGSVWCASTRKKYTLTGVYEAKADMDGVYAMSGGAFYLGNSSSPALSPFRFYLTVEDIDNGYGSGSDVANTPARIQIAVDDEAITGIDEVTGSMEQGEGSPSTSAIYDLSGRRVSNPTKGIYVRNGKKVFIK